MVKAFSQVPAAFADGNCDTTDNFAFEIPMTITTKAWADCFMGEEAPSS